MVAPVDAIADIVHKAGDLCQLDRMLRIFKFLQDHSCPFSDQNTMLFGMIGITHDT